MYNVFYDDIDVGATETFGSYTVSREEVIEFAGKYDPQPFHLDDEAAKKSIFGRLCASGWHTCAMTMRMNVDHMAEKKVASLGGNGIEELRWLRPVFPGDTLSVRTTILEKRESQSRPGLGLVKSKSEVMNQKGEVVMTQIVNYMMAVRPK
ncbi:MAG: MaoC family dehydratase [Alphaproteobacteria bacterium]|nr:MAG: MaoC family dehydratase [Alphaproteobacteria bacterium]